MTEKALGRCDQRHKPTVVEYDGSTLPAGTCKTCGGVLTEWAVKLRPTYRREIA